MGCFQFHQYQIVGRHIASEKYDNPPLYRMKIWAVDAIRARSKFWQSIRKLCRVKKANGQIISCNEIFEKNPTLVKNYGIWIRYQSRSGYHNAYKENRDTTMNGAVYNMYQEMASRHRVSLQSIKIIRSAVVYPLECKRISNLQYQDCKIKFPISNRILRSSNKRPKTHFKHSRPSIALR
jgi:large subunit ribosomal protein L18Ae